MRIVQRVLGGVGIVVVAWVLATSWGAVVHGHPAYAVVLALTLVASTWALARSFRIQAAPRGWRLAGRVAITVLAIGWLATVAWLRPFTAVEPALTAMASTATVSVTESPTSIALLPGLDMQSTGLFFQPGARVEARAYAAVLRPIADAGYPVVIAKQPLGIGFLAGGAFEAAREAYPEVSRWVVGGHSLGGTVAASEAHDHGGTAPVAGLLLYAAYPATDLSQTLATPVLSLSGSMDGLATPDDIAASRADLPADAAFVEIEGAVHSFFGDYGQQPGDGSPTIDQDTARSRIARETLGFVSAR